MTTASDTALEKKIGDAEEEIKDVKLKIKQVEAALEGYAVAPGEEQKKAFDRAGPMYSNRGEGWLEGELGRLRDYLTEKQKEKNLLLEARREEPKSQPWAEILEAPRTAPADATGVRAFLTGVLPKKMLVPDEVTIPVEARNSFEEAKKMSLQDSTDASLLLYDKLLTSSTENGNQSVWYKTVDRVFEILQRICELTITRNAASMGSSFTSSHGGTKRARTTLDESRLRADFAVLIDDVLVFMGEEKPASTTEALNDIKNKLVWTSVTHGHELPYLLAMSAAGTKAQFFVVESGTLSDRVKSVSDLFDISDSRQRFAFARHVINCARLSRKLRELIGATPVHVPAGRDGVVTLFANGAIKHVPFKTVKGDQTMRYHVVKETLKALYKPEPSSRSVNYVKTKCLLHDVPNCVQVERAVIDDGGLLLTLAPRGETVAPKPENPKDCAVALAALRDVLEALKALHLKGWVHRDIRWPNILKTQKDAKTSYILIDFEYAAKSGEKVTWRNDAHQPEEARKSRGTTQVGWQPKHDLWQVGALLDPFAPHNNNDDESLRELCDQLLKLDPKINVDAAIALLGKVPSSSLSSSFSSPGA
eukprot:CAMPEP_0118893590 /NCGR_PEP_ID=MMETSP1166-20130328/2733_1 /TAXON_ID=1104430 /ORGANISM="Chrysoreinhardia sp, Strain CCMP3193" /LENGTH=591 /DNA_ID=CAMNT_0006832415 /DNA_START=116 /DNA_END=1891 /DNA_ORIENTATION=-